MERFLQKLNTKMNDQTAAFIILGAMLLTFAILIGTFEYVRYVRVAEVTASAYASGKNISLQAITENAIQNELQESVIDEEETQKKNEEEFEKLKKEKKVTSAADKYYIKVNYGAQVVTVYTKDSNGKYTKPVKAMVCSTGRYTPTSGVYRTLGKGNWWPLMGDVFGQYSTWICGDILFHSVPYLESGNKSSLEYWAYDQLGQRVSMGCVRLTVADAKWIYNNCPVGTQVEFYSSSNPGPLGKPTTKKISDAPANVRGWDPTDPDSKNPWPKYLKDLEKKKEEDKNKDDNKKPDKDNEKPNGNKPDKDDEKPNTSNKPEEDTKPSDEEDKPISGDKPDDGEEENVNDIANDILTNTIDETNIISTNDIANM